MKLKHTPIASAVALVLMSVAYPALAQTTDAKPADAAKPADDKKKAEPEPQQVVVTGIRASLEQSLSRKRNADSVVEVITAEDIGKMPDKNVADSLQRVPGVTISSASASEGGFDEADRVSLRGTNPSLTQTMVNGHMIGSGDWFVLNQVGTVGRSVSYSLLPSELVGQVVVRKSATADQVEGGVAGTVDILTRQPLQFKKQLTLEASAGAVYADLPGKTDPQFSGLLNYKNEAGTMGVLVQAFSEKRHLRRDGQEMLGYGTIAPGSAIATSNPDLAGVMYPNAVGSALFEQVRERTGGLIDLQLKPTNELTLDLNGFKSHMKATNFNRNFMVWGAHILNGGAGQAPDAGYTVQNNTLTSATFTNVAGSQYAIDDQIYRPGANSDTYFVDFSAKYRPNDRLTVNGKIGSSTGKGETPTQAVFEADIVNTGGAWNLHGIGGPADASVPLGDPSNFHFPGTKLDWVFGASPAKTNDKDSWAQIDAEYAIDQANITTLKFGLRASEHKRDTVWVAQGPNWGADPFNVANQPAWNGTTYPGNFGSGLGGGNFPRNVWQLDPGVLQAWGDTYSNRDPVSREYFPGEFSMKENNTAAYVMANFEGQRWSGNVGVRLVRTVEKVLTNVGIPAADPNDPNSDCAPLKPCSFQGAITTSAFGAFYRKEVDNTYNDVLPSVNFKYDLSKDLVGRLAASKTIARPDFSALGGAVSLDDTNHTGSGGNPNLKPIRSTNLDASLEWYFAPKSLVSAGLFYMDLTNYVSFGTAPAVFFNQKTQAFETYNVSAPVNSSGKVKGLELSYQQPLAGGFGVVANYTYADAKEEGDKPLVGASKNTYNLQGYFENDTFNARLAYTYRSKFFNGLDRSTAQYQDNTGTLAASIGYRINDNLSVTLDGLNLNNPVLKYYANNTTQPLAFYNNGRQFYLMLRAKL